MVLWMKTTLNIDERLLAKAKRAAAERGETLTKLIEDALRGALKNPRPRPELDFRETWPVVADRRLPDVDISDRDSLYRRMEDPD